VREAFRKRGHTAYSCDLLPAEDGSRHHLQTDVLGVLEDPYPMWDLMIAHPPCQFLSVSGMHWNTRRPERALETEKALEFVQRLFAAKVPRLALENPIGIIGSRIRKADQIIQPWQFGEDASKQTCLWLRGLSPLKSTRIVPPAGWQVVKFAGDLSLTEEGEAWCPDCSERFADCGCFGPTEEGLVYQARQGVMFARRADAPAPFVWANQTPSGQNKLGPSPTRWKDRSRTYQGIADAMAEQWGIE
jgi:hypothetical protein